MIVFESGTEHMSSEEYAMVPERQTQDKDYDEDFDDCRPLVIDTRQTSCDERTSSGAKSIHQNQDTTHSSSEQSMQQQNSSEPYQPQPKTPDTPVPILIAPIGESSEPQRARQPVGMDYMPPDKPPDILTGMDHLSHLRMPSPMMSHPLFFPGKADALSAIYDDMLLARRSGDLLGLHSGGGSSSTSSSPAVTPSAKVKGSQPNKARRKNDRILPLSDGATGEKYVCPVCQKVLVSDHDLTKHIRSHNTTTAVAANTCTICGKQLSSQSSLDRHMLVHSGERPFKCKVCKMSFTTNGNMHRHMRIHDKEGESSSSLSAAMAAGKAEDKFTKSRLTSHKNGFMLGEAQLLHQHAAMTPVFPTPTSLPLNSLTFMSHAARSFGMISSPFNMVMPGQSKRRLHFPEPDDAIAMRESYSLPLPSPPKMPRLEPPQLTAADNETVTTMTKSETRLSPPQLSPKVMMPKKTFPLTEKVPAGEDSDAYVCPVCSKSFICKYGLETHMETHPAYALHCPSCHATFKSPRELEVHMFMVHTQVPSVVGSGNEDESNQISSGAAVGFHELDFVDFSIEKFPLVARAWCEDNLCRPASNYHHYVCSECNRGFPVRSALNMHLGQHTPQYATACNTCQARFTNSMALRKHELDHVASNVVDRFTDKSVDPEVEVQDLVSKEEFLAVVGLQVKRPSVLKDVVTPAVREEMRINNDYFVKIGQSSNFRPTKGYLDENCNDFGVRGNMADKSSPMTEIARMMPHAANLIAHQRALASMNSEMEQATAAMRQGEKPSFPMLLPTTVQPSRSGLMEDLGTPQPVLEGERKLALPHLIPKLEALTPFTPVESFSCKYCAQTFSSAKEQKSHERSHQGLTPYKCTLCPYSSADKSTLIRHLRTHNGERPYQCALCEFAFTTKANCERHVRKKHARETRAAIEGAMICLPSSTEAFSPPSTICRYCKVDFKFYRALKQHHIVSTVCRPRPYHCRVCDQDFVGHEESLLHVRQEHPEIEAHRVENAVLVAPGLLEVAQRSRSSSPASLIPRNASASSSASGLSVPESNSEQPLDFSLKSVSKDVPSKPGQDREPQHPPQMQQSTTQVEEAEEQPMDLSLHKRPARQVEAAAALNLLGISTPKPDYHSAGTMPSGQTPNHLRSRSLSPSSHPPSPSGSTLHISPESGYGSCVLPSPSMSSPDLSHRRHLESSQGTSTTSRTTEQVFPCHVCHVGFKNKPSLEHHLKTAHQQKIHDAFPATLPALLVGEEGTPGMLTIKRYLPMSMVTPKPSDNTSRPSPQTGYASDSGSDLASVTRILDAANSSKFPTFLLSSPSSAKPTSDSEEMATASMASDEIKRKMLQKIHADKNENSSCDSWRILQTNEPVTPPRMSFSPGASENSHSPDEGTKLKKKRNSYADSPHKLSCPYCPRAFPWVSSLNRHILTHTGQKPFKCPKCPVMFSTKSNRERHLVRKHGLNVLDPTTRQMMDRPFKCHLCIFSSFSTAGNLYKHYQEKHPETEMPIHLNDLSPGAEGADGYDNCDDFSETSETRRNMADMDEDEDDEPLIQDGLGQKLLDHSKVTQVMHESPLPLLAVTPPRAAMASPSPRQDTPLSSPPDTPERQMNPERDNYNVDKITDCWKCGQSFPARKYLLKHLKEHNIDLPFKCYLCDASYELRYESLEHLASTHQHDWTMLREKNQVENMSEFAKTLDLYVGYHFLGNRSLDVSQVDLSGLAGDDTRPEPDYLQRKVFCSLCPKRFWSLQDMRRHMRSHTGERPFECDICQKRFTLKHSMMRHRRKHLGQTGADVFSCSDEEASVTEDPTPAQQIQRTLESERKPSGWEGPGASMNKLPSQGDTAAENDSGLLHNLLGVEENDIDKLFDSADSAARLLGVQN